MGRAEGSGRKGTLVDWDGVGDDGDDGRRRMGCVCVCVVVKMYVYRE